MAERNPIVREALKLRGYASRRHDAEECKLNPYEHGMNPEEGLDCSAFVRLVLMRAKLPKKWEIPQQLERVRHCNEFFDSFGVLVHPGLHLPGDLVFFTRTGESPQHMGIVLDLDHYIHVDHDQGKIVKAEIKTEPLQLLYPNQIYIHNPIGFKRLAVKDVRWARPVSW